MASVSLGIQPSVINCIGLSAFGGAVEVISTMVLAYPEHRAREGHGFSKCCQRMLIASMAYVIGSWYGPVSISVPVVMISKLLFNMIIVGAVLKLEHFDKNQRVGTYVIAFAIVALPEVGPQPIAEQKDPIALIQSLMSRAWSAFLCGTMVITIIAMFVLKVLKHRGGAPRPTLLLSVLVGAQVTSAVVGTSVGKLFSAAEGMWIWICVGVSIVSAAVNVISLMMAASSVEQGIFVPLQTCATLGVNMLTGLVIWEDWRVVTHWFAYIALYCIMGLGIYMLTGADVLEMYKRRKQAKLAKSLTQVITRLTVAGPVPAKGETPHSALAQDELITSTVIQISNEGSDGASTQINRITRQSVRKSVWQTMLVDQSEAVALLPRQSVMKASTACQRASATSVGLVRIMENAAAEESAALQEAMQAEEEAAAEKAEAENKAAADKPVAEKATADAKNQAEAETNNVATEVGNMAAAEARDEAKAAAATFFSSSLQESDVPSTSKPEPDDPNLPPDWEAVVDSRGKTYFWNIETDEVSWRRPGQGVQPKKTNATAAASADTKPAKAQLEWLNKAMSAVSEGDESSSQDWSLPSPSMGQSSQDFLVPIQNVGPQPSAPPPVTFLTAAMLPMHEEDDFEHSDGSDGHPPFILDDSDGSEGGADILESMTPPELAEGETNLRSGSSGIFLDLSSGLMPFASPPPPQLPAGAPQLLSRSQTLD